jgi:hypothetical protein
MKSTQPLRRAALQMTPSRLATDCRGFAARGFAAIAGLVAVATLAGCAVPPVTQPGQTSIISRLPSDYAYAAPVPTPPANSTPLSSTPAQAAPGAPALSETERQQYAAIDTQVQRDQAQSMAAEQAAQNAWYYPGYYPGYYPAYSYYPAYYPAYSPYFASPVIVGTSYYGGWGRGGCCWRGGSRWSVGVGFGW